MVMTNEKGKEFNKASKERRRRKIKKNHKR